MFSRDYMIPNAKMLPYYFIAEFGGILLGLFSFIRLSLSINFFFLIYGFLRSTDKSKPYKVNNYNLYIM